MYYFHYEEMKSLLTVQETAKVLGVSEQTVYRLIHSEELPTVKIRFRFKIKAADLEKYVNRK